MNRPKAPYPMSPSVRQRRDAEPDDVGDGEEEDIEGRAEDKKSPRENPGGCGRVRRAAYDAIDVRMRHTRDRNARAMAQPRR